MSKKDKINTFDLEVDKTFVSDDDKQTFRQFLKKNNFNSIARKNRNPKLDKFLLVYMGSNQEYLNGIFRINKFDGNILTFTDRKDNWYHDIIDEVIVIIKRYITELGATNVILLGQSSGGYASLYISTLIDNAVCLAFNPQTFKKIDKININEKIHHNKEPEHLLDLKKIVNKSKTNSKRYIFAGKSECDSMYAQKGYFWMDSLFAGYMIDAENTKIIIAPKNMHPLLQPVEYKSFYTTIINNYDTLFNDTEKGAFTLNKEILYYDSSMW